MPVQSTNWFKLCVRLASIHDRSTPVLLRPHAGVGCCGGRSLHPASKRASEASDKSLLGFLPCLPHADSITGPRDVSAIAAVPQCGRSRVCCSSFSLGSHSLSLAPTVARSRHCWFPTPGEFQLRTQQTLALSAASQIYQH